MLRTISAIGFSSVRAASPVHLTYLRNMGITATAVVSLIVAGRLWGMLVCQHHAPRQVSPDLRALLELVGQVMSLMLGALSDAELSLRRLSRQGALSQIALAVAKPQSSISDILTSSVSDLLTLVPAQGVAVIIGTRTFVAGQTPEPKVFQTIITALGGLRADNLAATDSLKSLCAATTQLDGLPERFCCRCRIVRTARSFGSERKKALR